MTAKIAPEQISVGVTHTAKVAQNAKPVSRPIEDSGASSADTKRDHRAFGRTVADGNKPEPGQRPPGKDPSVLPQALFDAALIAAEYKPQTRQPDPEPKPIEASAPQPTPASEPRKETVTAEAKAPVEASSDETETANPAPVERAPEPEPAHYSFQA